MKYPKIKNMHEIKFSFQFEFNLNNTYHREYRTIILDRVLADRFELFVSDPYPITDVSHTERPLEYVRTISVAELKSFFTLEDYRVCLNHFNDNPKLIWRLYSLFIDYERAGNIVGCYVNPIHDEFRNFVYIRTGKGILGKDLEMPNITVSVMAASTPLYHILKASKGKTLVVEIPISDEVKKYAGSERLKLLTGELTLVPSSDSDCKLWTMKFGDFEKIFSDMEASVFVDNALRATTVLNIQRVLDCAFKN